MVHRKNKQSEEVINRSIASNKSSKFAILHIDFISETLVP